MKDPVTLPLMDLIAKNAFLLEMLPDGMPRDLEDAGVKRLCMATWLARSRGHVFSLPMLNWPRESRFYEDGYIIYTLSSHHTISYADVDAALVAPWGEKAYKWAFTAQAYGLWLSLTPEGRQGLTLEEALLSLALRVASIERHLGLPAASISIPTPSSIAQEYADRVTGLRGGKLEPSSK